MMNEIANNGGAGFPAIEICTSATGLHGLVVQRADNVIQWINRSPTDKMYSTEQVHFIHWITTYLLD